MKTPSSKRGFTMIEILVALAIIVILSSFVMSSMRDAKDKAKLVKARLDIKHLRQAIEFLISDANEWPDHKTVGLIQSGASGNEVWDLSTPEAGIIVTDGLYGNWNGPYISVVRQDPWGNNYFFDTDYDVDPDAGTTWAAVVGSFGPNGVGQNVYDSDNIYEIIVSE